MAHRILISRFSSLGDIVLASPTVLNLSIHYPDSRISFLTKESFADLVTTFDGVDEVLTVPSTIGVARYYQRLLEIDQRQFSLFVDLHGNARSWLARKTIGADQTVVYPKRRLERRLMTRRRGKQIPASWPHTIDMYNDVLRQLNCVSHADRPVLSTSRPKFLAPSRTREVVIAPGAAHPVKAWPIERFLEVAERVQRELAATVTWVYRSTGEDGKRLSAALEGRSEACLVDRPLVEVADRLRTASLCLANDSGLAHLASAAGAPVVALFGPTHPALGFAPRGLRDRVVEVDLWCRPCSRHGKNPCFREEQFCFSQMSVERVFKTVGDMLGETERLAPALFLDRDGTIIEEKQFLTDPHEVELIGGAAEALRKASEEGFRIVILSNQSGVARGYFGVAEVEQVNAELLEQLGRHGVRVDAVHFCPYHPAGTVPEFSRTDRSRKPSPQMAEDAAVELGIDLTRSWVVGDRRSDLDLGRVLGARSVLVRTGYGAACAKALPDRYRELIAVEDRLDRAILDIVMGDRQ